MAYHTMKGKNGKKKAKKKMKAKMTKRKMR